MGRTFQTPSRIHLALNTNHFVEAVAFYEVLLNTKPTKVKPGYAKFEVENPPLNLTLNESADVGGNQLNHLGIEVKVADAVQQQSERLQEIGLETLVEEATTCCYAVQDKVWVKDPDGNAWETFVVFEDSQIKQEPKIPKDCCSGSGKASQSCGA